MRLSRSKRLVLIGVALVTVGVAGRAAAGTTSTDAAKVTPSASASASAGPRPAPAKPKPAAKPAAAKPKPAKPAGTSHAGTPAAAGKGKKRTPTGPAGSRLTTGTKAVALTFDDGPDPAQTPKLLKLLAKQRVQATFCLVGENVRRHPELVRQIVAGGHALCNHTWNHSLKIGKQPAAKIVADLKRTNDAILKAAPKAKIKYFRAPGGNFTPRLVGVAKKLGMTSIYWKVDPRDWDHPKGETHSQHRARVIARVKAHTHNGAIVLSHDYAQPDTIAAYRTLLPWLRHRFKLIALP
jgi:peptidoglycan-N-acetylglucosamine deacetylase